MASFNFYLNLTSEGLKVIAKGLPTSAYSTISSSLSDGQLYITQDFNDAFNELCDLMHEMAGNLRYRDESEGNNDKWAAYYRDKINKTKTKSRTQYLVASKKVD